MRAWVFPATATVIFWGLFGFIPKITIRYISPTSASVYAAFAGIPVALIIMAIMRFQLDTEPRGVILAGITGVLGMLGALGYLVAVSRRSRQLDLSLYGSVSSFHNSACNGFPRRDTGCSAVGGSWHGFRSGSTNCNLGLNGSDQSSQTKGPLRIAIALG